MVRRARRAGAARRRADGPGPAQRFGLPRPDHRRATSRCADDDALHRADRRARRSTELPWPEPTPGSRPAAAARSSPGPTRRPPTGRCGCRGRCSTSSATGSRRSRSAPSSSARLRGGATGARRRRPGARPRPAVPAGRPSSPARSTTSARRPRPGARGWVTVLAGGPGHRQDDDRRAAARPAARPARPPPAGRARRADRQGGRPAGRGGPRGDRPAARPRTRSGSAPSTRRRCTGCSAGGPAPRAASGTTRPTRCRTTSSSSTRCRWSRSP